MHRVRRPSSPSSEVGDSGSSGSVVPAGPGRSTDRTKVIGVVAPVGRAYLDDALARFSSTGVPVPRTRAPCPVPRTPYPVPRAPCPCLCPYPYPYPCPYLYPYPYSYSYSYSYPHSRPYRTPALCYVAVPFRPVRSIACGVSCAVPRLVWPCLVPALSPSVSFRLALPRVTYPFCASHSVLPFLATPCFHSPFFARRGLTLLGVAP